MRVQSLSHVWLFVTLWTAAQQAPLSMGFSRQEYWSGLPFPPPENLPDPGIEPVPLMSPALEVYSLPLHRLRSQSNHSIALKIIHKIVSMSSSPPSLLTGLNTKALLTVHCRLLSFVFYDNRFLLHLRRTNQPATLAKHCARSTWYGYKRHSSKFWKAHCLGKKTNMQILQYNDYSVTWTWTIL